MWRAAQIASQGLQPNALAQHVGRHIAGVFDADWHCSPDGLTIGVVMVVEIERLVH